MRSRHTKKCRVLKGALLIPAIALMVAPAHAFNVSKTWSLGSGWFGGTAWATGLDIKTMSSYTISATAGADASILKKSIRLARAESGLSLDKASHGTAKCKINLAGADVVNFDRSFTAAAEFKSTPITKELVGGSLRFSVFGLPARISASATCSVWAEGHAALTPTAAGPSIQGKVGPACDAAVHAAGSFNAILIAGKISGDLSLYKQSLKSGAQIVPVTNTVTYSLTADHIGAEGSVRATLKLRLLFWRKTVRKTLWDWHSKPEVNELATGVITL